MICVIEYRAKLAMTDLLRRRPSYLRKYAEDKIPSFESLGLNFRLAGGDLVVTM